MTIKEIREVKNKSIPWKVRQATAIKIRDFRDAAHVVKDSKVLIEVFHSIDVFREPDSIGVTMQYPAGKTFTHRLTKIYPLSVKEKGFQRLIKQQEKDLLKKVK